MNITPLKKNIKLRELRPLLKASEVNLYIEVGVPIKFELYGMDDKTGSLAEYTLLDDDYCEGDVMFKMYGDYNVDEIGAEDDGVLYIGINNSK